MRRHSAGRCQEQDDDESRLLFVLEDPSSQATTSKNRTAVRSQVTKDYWRRTKVDHSQRPAVGIGDEVGEGEQPDSNIDLAIIPSLPRQEVTGQRSTSEVRSLGGYVDTRSTSQARFLDDIQDLNGPNSILGQGYEDPFQSYPSRLKSAYIARLTHHSIEELWPGLRATDARGLDNPLVKEWLAPSITHPTLFHALMFGAAVHLQTRRSLQQPSGAIAIAAETPELLALHYKATQFLNKTLQDSVLASSDETICAVMILACSGADLTVPRSSRSCFDPPLTSMQWLDVYATIDMSEMHFQGLEHLLKMRGGLSNLSMDGVADIIVTGDLINASKNLSKPRFPWYSSFKSERRQSSQNPFLADFKLPSEPLETSFWTLEHSGLPAELLSVMQSMQDYVEMIKSYVRGTMTRPNMNLLIHHRNLVQYQLLALSPADDLGELFTQMCPKYEACRLAALVFGIGITFPLPVWAAPFPRLIVGLRQALISSDLNGVWNEDLRLLLWMLAVGGIAATDLPVRDWVVSTLGGVVARLRLTNWETARAMLNEILWLDSACERGGRSLWDDAQAL